MTSPLDPVRQIARLRRLRRRTDGVSAGDGETPNLPATVEPQSAPPAPEISTGAPPVLSTHILAQGEQRRGLRAGASTLDAARSAYSQTEYSGRADRRARKGGLTRTDI